MHQNTPNYNSNIHFGPPGYPGGASGAQNLKIAVPGGYLKDRIWVLWNFCPIFGHLTLFGWLKLEILTLMVYHTPLLRMRQDCVKLHTWSPPKHYLSGYVLCNFVI